MKSFEESVDNSPTLVGGLGRVTLVSLAAGAVLGNYRIIRPLGAGGMGVVYLVEHVHQGTRHALKTIRPEFAKQQNISERFQREAKLTMRLKHPHIVACTDASVADGTTYEDDLYPVGMPGLLKGPKHTSDHTLYLVMDYIEGPAGEPLNLRQLLDQRRERGEQLEEDEATAVGLEICKALDYAHSYRDAEIPNGIIHRDLKPANILLDKDTKLYIADFGLARTLGEKFEESVIQAHALSRSLSEDATLKGQVSISTDTVGTFDYMSPEQREGRVADVRSDVYAMGAILYELLTGRKVVGVPAPPSRVRPGLSPVWDKIILKRALAYDPDQRFSSAGDLRRAIEEVSAQPFMAADAEISVSARTTAGIRPLVLCEKDDNLPVIPPSQKRGKGGLIIASIAGLLMIGGLWVWLPGPKQERLPQEQKTVDLGGGVKMYLVWIPPGDFLMGSPPGEEGCKDYERPQHRVTLFKGFWMGKTEITQAQWEQVMGSNPSKFKGAKLPVECVSWVDCQEFIKALNLKLKAEYLMASLPTETQWEYACRAGTTTRFHSGDTDADLARVGWFFDNGKEQPHEIGQKKANPWGLFDMHGNVWEWCQDWYGPYENANAWDPLGPSSGTLRVLRGGAWDNYSKRCRSASRDGDVPSDRISGNGLRVVVVSFFE